MAPRFKDQHGFGGLRACHCAARPISSGSVGTSAGSGSSSRIAASSLQVPARARGFVRCPRCVSALAAESFGSFVQVRGALNLLLSYLRCLAWPAALTLRLRSGCGLTTRWSKARPCSFGEGIRDVEVLDQSASISVSGAALRSTRTLEHPRNIWMHARDRRAGPFRCARGFFRAARPTASVRVKRDRFAACVFDQRRLLR